MRRWRPNRRSCPRFSRCNPNRFRRQSRREKRNPPICPRPPDESATDARRRTDTLQHRDEIARRTASRRVARRAHPRTRKQKRQIPDVRGLRTIGPSSHHAGQQRRGRAHLSHRSRVVSPQRFERCRANQRRFGRAQRNRRARFRRAKRRARELQRRAARTENWRLHRRLYRPATTRLQVVFPGDNFPDAPLSQRIREPRRAQIGQRFYLRQVGQLPAQMVANVQRAGRHPANRVGAGQFKRRARRRLSARLRAILERLKLAGVDSFRRRNERRLGRRITAIPRCIGKSSRSCIAFCTRGGRASRRCGASTRYRLATSTITIRATPIAIGSASICIRRRFPTTTARARHLANRP